MVCWIFKFPLGRWGRLPTDAFEGSGGRKVKLYPREGRLFLLYEFEV